MGLIVRTAGVGKIRRSVAVGFKLPLRNTEAIPESRWCRPAPFPDPSGKQRHRTRVSRLIQCQDIGETLIDNPKGIRKWRVSISPRWAARILAAKLLLSYTGEIPLFSHYQIESQIESTAFQREVRLPPSGGSIVIDSVPKR